MRPAFCFALILFFGSCRIALDRMETAKAQPTRKLAAQFTLWQRSAPFSLSKLQRQPQLSPIG